MPFMRGQRRPEPPSRPFICRTETVSAPASNGARAFAWASRLLTPAQDDPCSHAARPSSHCSARVDAEHLERGLVIEDDHLPDFDDWRER